MIITDKSDEGFWLRGNLHSHTTNSDGKFSLEELCRRYEEKGYDFLVVTDHDKVTSLCSVSGSLILISGCEVSAGGGHIVAIGIEQPVEPHRDRQKVIDRVNGEGGVCVLAHPNWSTQFCHWHQEELERLQGYAGIEVFNGNILRDSGSPLASDRWDRLLSQGRKVFAYGTDDTHNELDVANGWTMVWVRERSREAILKSLASGHCYASSGVFFDDIRLIDRTVVVVTKNADRIAFVGRHGRWLYWVNDSKARYSLQGNEGYVRVEAYGPHGSCAWSQPLWLDEPANR
ncbi:MAG: CehA/McbA family metallohydrolase [Armatimonadetes bacterium]|nr:CehA/McbA family metallohydrolase [Armatimonadota bacterium]MDW8121286.1 CehA/McbA family metallohydrolase [Armatimonadota bacterium]